MLPQNQKFTDDFKEDWRLVVLAGFTLIFHLILKMRFGNDPLSQSKLT